MLTNENGHSGYELNCCTRSDFADHRPKLNEFYFPAIFVSALGSVNILSSAYYLLGQNKVTYFLRI